MAMARVRKRHVQQELFTNRGRGGKRTGAGRPRKGRGSAPHRKRPTLKASQPVHVVLRVARDVGSLRKRHMYKALREATITVLKRELSFRENGAFRIVHMSIQGTHVHLLVEASHATALSRGMQSFQISAAKHINRAIRERTGKRRKGSVFPDRFHETIIKSPRQARHALAYVLNNWRKHREDRERFAQGWKMDPYSTAVLFAGWKEREDEPCVAKYRPTYEPLAVYFPQTWLLKTGWRRHGLVSFYETPRE
jgi:putative transposase